jgi:hypothetical protein
MAMKAGENENGPFGNNNMTINAGNGTFSLNFMMRIEGYPHVSFYPVAGGQSLGSLYFGSGKYVYR